MSIFRSVKQFLNGPRTSVVWVDPSAVSMAELEQSSLPAANWEVTKGRLYYPQQERKVTFHNSEISGTCTGEIGELTGSVMVGLFEDLPTWLPNLLIQVSLRTDEGELTASLREGNGTVVSVSSPGLLEGNVGLIRGQVWLRCESGPTPARHIRYEAIII